MNKAQLRRILYHHQPDEMECIAGYQLYAVDCTEDEHPEANTLPDRHQTRKGKFAPKIIGHRYSWITRLGQWRTPWCLPQDVERALQTQQTARWQRNKSRSLAAEATDARLLWRLLYGNDYFLSVFMVVTTVFVLVRLRSNRVLYEEPSPRDGKRRRPRKYGAKFKLKEPSRLLDRLDLFSLQGQTVRIQAWHNLHFYKLPFLVGLVLCVEFLRADGTLRCKRPLYLFLTGATTSLLELCRMYLWHFAIEHMFRFLKQHMGLSTSRSPNLAHNERWLWCCALAYAQLALMRHAVPNQRPPWHPRQTQGQSKPMTPRQVQRVALSFLLVLGLPAQPTQPRRKRQQPASGRLSQAPSTLSSRSKEQRLKGEKSAE